MECSNGQKNANAADSRRSRSDSVGIEMEHAYATGVIIEDEDPLRLPEETTIPEIKTEIKMEDIEIKQEETESLETEYSPETEFYENMDTSLGNVPFTSSLSVETETETEKYSPFNVGSVPKDVYMELQENYKLKQKQKNLLMKVNCDLEPDFVKGCSDNLPKVDSDMVYDYFATNINSTSAGLDKSKTKRADKVSYGDNAIDYVQVKRSGCMCTVKGKIIPDNPQKINKKVYEVVAIINEKDEVILIASCLSCAAYNGKCKHGIAFLLWLHRRSEEPSATKKTFYWKDSSASSAENINTLIKTKLPDVGPKSPAIEKNHTLLKTKLPDGGPKSPALENFNTLLQAELPDVDSERPAIEDINTLLKSKLPDIGPKSPSFLEKVIITFPNATGCLFDFYKEQQFSNTSIHQIMVSFQQKSKYKTANSFLQFAKSIMKREACEAAEKKTKNHLNSADWVELTFGRIMDTDIHEAASSKFYTEALTDRVLGVAQQLDCDSFKRCIPFVLEVVARKKCINIKQSGLVLSPDHPIFVAVPDGITDEFVISVECPFSEKGVEQCFFNGRVKNKYYYQMQLQMLIARKQKGYFCVASPHFRLDNEVIITELKLDKQFEDIVELAELYWKSVIFPLLNK